MNLRDNNTFIITETQPSVRYLKKKDKRLALLISRIGDIECNIHEDYFEFIVEQIVGQLLSAKAANVLIQRLHSLCNGRITPQKIIVLSFEEINSLGISRQKVNYIKGFGELICNSEFTFDGIERYSDSEIIDKLTAVKGIGQWTAKMFLIFALCREDVLPFEDIAFIQSYKWLYNTNDVNKESIIKRCNKWKPYSSIAARYLYRALDMGLTKEKNESGKGSEL